MHNSPRENMAREHKWDNRETLESQSQKQTPKISSNVLVCLKAEIPKLSPGKAKLFNYVGFLAFQLAIKVVA